MREGCERSRTGIDEWRTEGEKTVEELGVSAKRPPKQLIAECLSYHDVAIQEVATWTLELTGVGQNRAVWKTYCSRCGNHHQFTDRACVGVDARDWYPNPLLVQWAAMCATCPCETTAQFYYPVDAAGYLFPTHVKAWCAGCGERIMLTGPSTRWMRDEPPPPARRPFWLHQSPMDPAMLAEAVQMVVTDAMARVGPESVGAQQYWQPGKPQLFETMPLPALQRYYREELLDLITYAAMMTIRLDRLGTALQAKIEAEATHAD